MTIETSTEPAKQSGIVCYRVDGELKGIFRKSFVGAICTHRDGSTAHVGGAEFFFPGRDAMTLAEAFFDIEINDEDVEQMFSSPLSEIK